jgi:PAS domain S-box-containing protein
MNSKLYLYLSPLLVFVAVVLLSRIFIQNSNDFIYQAETGRWKTNQQTMIERIRLRSAERIEDFQQIVAVMKPKLKKDSGALRPMAKELNQFVKFSRGLHALPSKDIMLDLTELVDNPPNYRERYGLSWYENFQQFAPYIESCFEQDNGVFAREMKGLVYGSWVFYVCFKTGSEEVPYLAVVLDVKKHISVFAKEVFSIEVPMRISTAVNKEVLFGENGDDFEFLPTHISEGDLAGLPYKVNIGYPKKKSASIVNNTSELTLASVILALSMSIMAFFILRYGVSNKALKIAKKSSDKAYKKIIDKDLLINRLIKEASMTGFERDVKKQSNQWVPGAEKILGVSRSRLSDESFFYEYFGKRFFHSCYVRCLEDKVSKKKAFYYRGPSGKSLYLEALLVPVLEDGEVVTVRCILKDITEYRLAKKELEKAYRELSYQSDALNEHAIVSMTDRGGKIFYVNEKFVEVSGFSHEELIGSDHSIVNSAEHGEAFWLQFWNTISRGDTWHGEVCNRSKSGELYWVESTIVPHKNAQGEIDRYVAIRTDVTDRKLAMLDNERLSRYLLQSQKMEAVGQLTGGIAHDFNNILSATNGYTDLAIERAGQLGDEKLLKYLNQVEVAGKRGADLVRKMLDFSRSGDHVDSIVIDPGLCLNESITLLRPVMPASISLSIEKEKALPNIQFDPTQLQQIIMNCCINSRDAIGDKGRIKVSVSTAEIENRECNSCHTLFTGKFLLIEIADDGKGIDKDVLKRAFDPFFTTKEIGKGTGMGLSMVHGIIHKSGGHVMVESESGKGCTIKLLIPVSDSMDKRVLQAKSRAEEEHFSGCALKLMLVDDEPAILSYLKEALSGEAVQVSTFKEGGQAIEAINTGPFYDCVLTDITMPAVTGVEVAKAAKQHNKDMLVVGMTGYSELVDSSNYKTYGFDYLLDKPLKLVEIRSILKKHFENRELS